ncbi:hypothetical protein [Flavobacterium sp.]|uniref:hypothetical protein n=1 Tax=Flavobacterium sp. TaxID=239 RepID=UPI003D6A4BCE
MALYSKNIMVEAIQYTGKNADEVILFSKGQLKQSPIYSHLIHVISGDILQIGDYLVYDSANGLMKIQKLCAFESEHQKIQK